MVMCFEILRRSVITIFVTMFRIKIKQACGILIFLVLGSIISNNTKSSRGCPSKNHRGSMSRDYDKLFCFFFCWLMSTPNKTLVVILRYSTNFT